MFNFNHEPTFAELWDKCVYHLLYNADDFKKDMERLFDKLKISKESKIIDVAAGGGFPTLELFKDGYNVACTDGYSDQVSLFNLKAKDSGLDVTCTKVFWYDLPSMYANDSFDFLFCRGNSFIYAGGAWNSMIDIDPIKAINDYKSTLKIFYDLLKPHGWIYIDKFKDSETTHREKVGKIKVNDEGSEELIFWTERFPEEKVRRASILRKKENGEEHGVPNITYDLTFPELRQLLESVGFSAIESVKIPSEKHFDIILAQK